MTKKGEFLTCLEVLNKSSEFLRAKGVPSPKCDSEWIASSILHKKRMELYLYPDEIIGEEELKEIRTLIVRRGKREPLQHILGNVNFAGLTIKCDKRALIPRPETETLVEHILQRIHPSFDGTIVDMGTGSGAILAALCSSLPSSSGIGVDQSENALSLASENLKALNLMSRTELRQLDWSVQKVREEGVGLIVSNPPYLKLDEWEYAEIEVKKHDPKGALVAEENGFSELRKIIRISTEILSSGGMLALEFGASHADLITEALSSEFENVEILKDLSHYRRFSIAIKT
jgi:release factor glutamine methyltransferase